jgi:hypothetical protein
VTVLDMPTCLVGTYVDRVLRPMPIWFFHRRKVRPRRFDDWIGDRPNVGHLVILLLRIRNLWRSRVRDIAHLPHTQNGAGGRRRHSRFSSHYLLSASRAASFTPPTVF